MTERLLQFIWQFQYFNKSELQLATGESLQILHHGQYNTHQGPDFLQGAIKIGDTRWVGNIELHVLSSDWFRHSHQNDKNYNNVILHVVWIDDLEREKSLLPLLSLQDKVPKMLLSQYQDWMRNSFFIPCGQQLTSVNTIIWDGWKERLLIERLERKKKMIEKSLHACQQNWEETFWWLVSRNFGSTVNGDAFESIAKSLPINLLARHKSQINVVEALLFGQAGLLEGMSGEPYIRMLTKEYRFYKKKYRLEPIHEPIHFLRMRPENFPSIRLAQLAMLIHQSSHLFSQLLELTSVVDVKKLLTVTANDYWHYHYRPGGSSTFKPKTLGDQMANNLIINTITPILYAFGVINGKPGLKDRVINWLAHIPGENNKITNDFALNGISSKTAFDSQSVIELKKSWCDNRRCLDCAVGNAILKKNLA